MYGCGNGQGRNRIDPLWSEKIIMNKGTKAWLGTLAILMLAFGVAAFVTHNITAALWLTALFLIFGLVGLLIT